MATQSSPKKHKPIKYVQIEPLAILGNICWQKMNSNQRGAAASIILYLFANNGSIDMDTDTLKAITNCRQFSKVWQRIAKLFKVRNNKLSHPMVTKELRRVKKLAQVNTERALKAARARYASDTESCSEHARSMLNDSQGKVSNVKESEGKISNVTERKGKGRKGKVSKGKESEVTVSEGKESEVTVSEVTASDGTLTEVTVSEGKESNRVNPQGHLTGKPAVKPRAKYTDRTNNVVTDRTLQLASGFTRGGNDNHDTISSIRNLFLDTSSLSISNPAMTAITNSAKRSTIAKHLMKTLKARTLSDRTAHQNIARWLVEGIENNKFTIDIIDRVLTMADESKNARNPNAAFTAMLKRQLGYLPPSSKK